MEIRIIDRSEVRRLLPMSECIGLMERALKQLAEGKGVQPLRSIMWLADGRGALGMMPACSFEPPALSIKLVTIFPENKAGEYDSHQGAVLLFDSETGCLLAVVEAGSITAVRTAAVSAVATRLLAREDAGDLAILGSGVQASRHLEALSQVRPLRRVRVWSPTREHRETFAARESAHRNLPIHAAEDARSAVEGADLICTVTFSREPILKGEWVRPGAHINAVGSSIPATRELDTEAVVRSSLFVDRLESTLNEAGDFLMPRAEGALDDKHIKAEVGKVLAGQSAGRTSGREITLFKSLGLGIEDAVAVEHVYRRALDEGVGASVPFGGPINESR